MVLAGPGNLIALFSLLAAFSGPEAANASPRILECYEETFCLETETTGGSIAVMLQSLVSWDVSLELQMHLQNMKSDVPLPVVRSFPGNSRTRILTLNVVQRQRGWSFDFDLKWATGQIDARHTPGFAYSLPFARGEEYLVGQGFNGSATHQGRNAIDWDMPEGTEVCAARGGVVIDLEESYYRGGVDPSLKSRANYVSIRHDDGTIGMYVHLKQNGVRVHVGDTIRTGEVIGYSGKTGFASGPHLHFEVYTLSKDLERRTIPVQFRSAGRASEILQEGHYYRN